MTTKQYLQLQDIYAENCDASGNITTVYPALGLGVRGNYEIAILNASALQTEGVDSWMFAIGQDFDADTHILYENTNVSYAVSGTSGLFTVTEVSGTRTNEMVEWIGDQETPTVVGELIGMGADHNKNKPVSLIQWRMFVRNRVDYEGQEMDVVPSYVTSGMLEEALGGVIAKAGGDFTGEIGVHRLKSGSVSIPIKPSPSGTDYFAFNYDEETGAGSIYPCILFNNNPSLSPNGEDSIEFQNATTVQWRARRKTRPAIVYLIQRFTYPLVYDGSKYYGEHYFTTSAGGPYELVGDAVTYLSQSTLSRKSDAWMLEVSLSSDSAGAFKNVYRSEIDTSQIMDIIPYATISGGVFENGIKDGRTDGIYATSSDFATVLNEPLSSLTTDTGTLTIYDNPWDNPESIRATVRLTGNRVWEGTLPRATNATYFLSSFVYEGLAIFRIGVSVAANPPNYTIAYDGGGESGDWNIPQSWERSKFIPTSGGTFTGAISASDGNPYTTSGQYEEMIQSRIDNPELAGDNYAASYNMPIEDVFLPFPGSPTFISEVYGELNNSSLGTIATRELKVTATGVVDWTAKGLGSDEEYKWIHKPVSVNDNAEHAYYITVRLNIVSTDPYELAIDKSLWVLDCWKID